MQELTWMKLHKEINHLSNHKFSIKHYDISQYDKLFNHFPLKQDYMRHRNILANGARIGLNHNYPPRLSNDNPSFSTSEKIGIGQQLKKWLKTGVVLGPFDKSYAEANGVTLNMLFGVPKPDGSTRPILNLSDDKGIGFSINNLLDPTLCTVEYAQTKQVVQTVRALGKNAWLWAKDLKDGYYNVSINFADIHKLGFIFEEKIYLFQRLPMGLSSSPKIFTDFMKFPIWAIKTDRPDLYYVNIDPTLIDLNTFIKDADVYKTADSATLAILFYYLDDILGGHPSKKKAWEQFKHSETILKKLSLQTKNAKSKPPAQIQRWLGKLYDTVKQWLKLPPEKVEKYVKDLKILLTKKSVSKRVLLSHIGRTRHMASIYRPLAAFARNLEVWAHSVPYLSHHIRLSRPLKNDIDLCIWGMLRASNYGISFDQFLKPALIPDIILYTDASLKIGIGGYSNEGHWIKQEWKNIKLFQANNRDIVWRELVAIYAFIDSLKYYLNKKTVHVYTDNEPCKYMLISMRSKLKRPDLQRIINEICKIFIEFEITPWIEHIPGKSNIIPDALSRNKPLPYHLSHKCSKYIEAADSIQSASNLCKNIIINNKHLQMCDI